VFSVVPPRNSTMPLCYEGKLSLYCYLSSAVIVVVFTLADLFLDSNYSFSWQVRLLTILSLYLAINVVIRKKFQKNDYQVGSDIITSSIYFGA
jgi:hypothetical protein